MNCTQCGEPVVAGDLFCGSCGAALAHQRVCAVCRASIPADAHFCTSCGAALEGSTTASPSVESESAPPYVAPTATVAQPFGAAPPAASAPSTSPPSTSPPSTTWTTTTWPTAAAGQVAGPADPADPTGPPAAAPFQVATLVTLLAAAAGVVGSLLAWFDFFGTTTNAFDIAAPFLVDRQTTASDTVTVGALIAVLGAVAVVVALVPTFSARTRVLRGLGVGMIAVAAAFAFQMARIANDIGVSFGDVIGIGPFITGVAGIALLIAT